MRIANFASAALGVIVGAGITLLATPAPLLPITPTFDAPVLPVTPTVDDDLLRRIENLERRTEPATRTVVEAAAPTDLDSRLRAIEAQLTDLRGRSRVRSLNARERESPECQEFARLDRSCE